MLSVTGSVITFSCRSIIHRSCCVGFCSPLRRHCWPLWTWASNKSRVLQSKCRNANALSICIALWNVSCAHLLVDALVRRRRRWDVDGLSSGDLSVQLWVIRLVLARRRRWDAEAWTPIIHAPKGAMPGRLLAESTRRRRTRRWRDHDTRGTLYGRISRRRGRKVHHIVHLAGVRSTDWRRRRRRDLISPRGIVARDMSLACREHVGGFVRQPASGKMIGRVVVESGC